MVRKRKEEEDEQLLNEDGEGEDDDEEEEDGARSGGRSVSSKDTMQIVKRMRNDPSLREISKQSLDLDTAEDEDKMFELLKKNPFVQYDAETDRIRLNSSMCAVSTQNVRDKIEEFRQGVSREDLVEFDANLNVPIREHLRNSAVFALKGWRDSNKHVLMLYPRGTDFLVPLCSGGGKLRVSANRHFIETQQDLRGEVRRGDSLVIEGKPYRVSCELSPLDGMPARELREYIKNYTGEEELEQEHDMLVRKAHMLTQTGRPRNNNPGGGGVSFALAGTDLSALEKLPAPFSSSSIADGAASASSSSTRYKLDFTATMLPIDPPYRGSSSGVELAQVHKHGATNDVRRAYWQVAGQVDGNFKNNKDGSDKLDSLLLQTKALSAGMLDGINRNRKELDESLSKRAQEQQQQQQLAKQRGGRRRRA